MNQLKPGRRAEVLRALCLGASLRGVARSTGISINTATKLLKDAGEICTRLHAQRARNLNITHLHCNKALARIVTTGIKIGRSHSWSKGVWTWAAFDGDTGLIIAHHVGDGDEAAAKVFWCDLQSRIIAPPDAAFHRLLLEGPGPVDLILAGDGEARAWTRGPPETVGLAVAAKMAEGRFTRMRNAYARSAENFDHMVAINTVWHNYVRHTPEQPTRAMRAGLADAPWSFEDVLASNPHGAA